MNRVSSDDPRCPECGEPIGITAAYCMHCSADLTEERKRATGDDGDWNSTSRPSSPPHGSVSIYDTGKLGELLNVDEILETPVTAGVGLIAGLVIGTIEFMVVIGIISFGSTGILSLGVGFAASILVGFGTTAYLVRQQTVQEAVSKSAYAIAIAIMSFPLIVFNPTWDTETGVVFLDFVILEVICAFPAAIVCGLGFLTTRFIPAGHEA